MEKGGPCPRSALELIRNGALASPPPAAHGPGLVGGAGAGSAAGRRGKRLASRMGRLPSVGSLNLDSDPLSDLAGDRRWRGMQH